MVFIILGNGYEEAEAIVPFDILVRGGVDVRFISTGTSPFVTSAHGLSFKADYVVQNVIVTKEDTVIIPGGMGGVKAIKSNVNAMDLISDAEHRGANLAAICAGPSVLAERGYLDGKNITCHPDCKDIMGNAICHTELSVCEDGKIITARSVGSAVDFGLAILAHVKGKAQADKVRQDIVY